VPEEVFNLPEPVPCPTCRASLLVRVFPAFHRGVEIGRAAEPLGSAEDASCFYHPRKKAVVPCADCGRFLCALCDLEIDGRHICPSCASRGTTTGSPALGQVEGVRVLHDTIALYLATAPLLLWPFSLFTSPVALGFVVRYWNEPKRHPFGRTRLRLILAALFAVATLAGWGTLFFFLLRHYF
jgi:hypothetical protein